MRITESQLRAVIREEILREQKITESYRIPPQGTLDAVIDAIKDLFRPSDEKRLSRAGDDRVLRDLTNELGTFHRTPEYKVAWENYKTLQRQHRSMDTNPSIEKSLARLKERMYQGYDTAEASLSQENRDIWGPGLDFSRRCMDKLWRAFENRKITAGGLLGMLDPAGIVESKRIRTEAR
jgi:hypothetical protein